MKIESSTFWLFPEDLKAEGGNLFEFVETKPYVKNGKESGQVFILLGETTKANGEFQTFPGKISNLKLLMKQLGDDDVKWKGKMFLVTADGEKMKFTLY